MQIKKDRGIRMTDNGETVLVGTLRHTSRTHYRIEVAGTGEVEVPRSDAEFAGASQAEVAAWAEQQQEQQQPQKPKQQNSTANSARTYTVAGYSTLQGRRRLRLSRNLSQRVARLKQCGDSDIRMLELPCEMTREQAKQWLAEQGVD